MTLDDALEECIIKCTNKNLAKITMRSYSTLNNYLRNLKVFFNF